MSRISKGLAFVAGTGAVVGLANALSRLSNRQSLPHSAEDILGMEPLLDRLEWIEARLGPAVQEQAGRIKRELEIELNDSVDRKISERISVMERTLLEQSIATRALHERAETFDANLQRLATAIERLCDRSGGPTASPFDRQLESAMEDPRPQPEFRAESEIKRPKFAMARIFPR